MAGDVDASNAQAGAGAGRAQVSVWALAALLCSMAVLCPVLTILGPLFALRALIQIKAQPEVYRGTKFAVWAIVLGAVFTLGWLGAGFWWNANVRQPIKRGPVEELRAGIAGDFATFQAGFFGDGATANDAEVQSFFDAVRARYGRLDSIEENWTDRATGQLPTAGRARVPYILHFERLDVDAEAEFAITADGRPPMVLKWGWLRIIDPRGGDLVYPVSAAAAISVKPQAATSPP